MTDHGGEQSAPVSDGQSVLVGIVTGCLALAAILSIGGWYLFSPKDEVQEITASASDSSSGLKSLSGATKKTKTARSPAGGELKPYRPGPPALNLKLADGRELQKIAADSGVVYAVSVSPDGKRILAGASNTSIRVWSTATGKLMDLYERHRAAVGAVAYSPDGSRALTGSWDRSARYWNTKTGALIRVLRDHRWPVLCVAVSPDGKRALTGSDGFRLWNLETGRVIHHFTAHKGIIWSVAFSPDGKQALTGSSDKTMWLWDLSNFQRVRQFEGFRGRVKCVRFSPSGDYAASCDTSDSVIRIWNVGTGETIRKLKGHTHGVAGIAFSPDGRHLLSGAAQQHPRSGAYVRESKDRSIRLWRLEDGKELLAIDQHKAYVASVAFTPDGLNGVAGCGDGTVRVFRLFDPATKSAPNDSR